MVVCKFFQQGYCRYGQNCRFEHIYGSKYTYHANNTQQTAAPPQPTGCTDEQLVNQVQADIQSALQGGQWILSCYSPFKEKPVFPGISDLSPEEARLFIYEAKNNNTLDEAVNYMNHLFEEARQKYKQLLQPNVNIIKVLRSLYKGEVVPSPFTNTAQNTFGSNNTASSIFRSAVQSAQPMQSQNTAASIFSQGQKSIFAPQSEQPDLFSRANNSSVFDNILAPVKPDLAKSVFASAVQKTNQFAPQSQPNPSSLFSAANQNLMSSAPAQNNSLFTQQQSSPFTQAQNTSPFNQGNVFQASNAKSIFGQANSNFNNNNDPSVYSKMEEVSEADLEAFKSDHFELGYIPEVAPPHELCTHGI